MTYLHSLLPGTWPFLCWCSDGRFNICADASGPGYGDNEQDCLQPLILTLLPTWDFLSLESITTANSLAAVAATDWGPGSSVATSWGWWYPRLPQGTRMHAEPTVVCAPSTPYVGS